MLKSDFFTNAVIIILELSCNHCHGEQIKHVRAWFEQVLLLLQVCHVLFRVRHFWYSENQRSKELMTPVCILDYVLIAVGVVDLWLLVPLLGVEGAQLYGGNRLRLALIIPPCLRLIMVFWRFRWTHHLGFWPVIFWINGINGHRLPPQLCQTAKHSSPAELLLEQDKHGVPTSSEANGMAVLKAQEAQVKPPPGGEQSEDQIEVTQQFSATPAIEAEHTKSISKQPFKSNWIWTALWALASMIWILTLAAVLFVYGPKRPTNVVMVRVGGRI